jgi:hypothetical protein
MDPRIVAHEDAIARAVAQLSVDRHAGGLM